MSLEQFRFLIPGFRDIIEILIVAETFAFVALGLLLFSKVFPLIPLFDIKEGMIGRAMIKIGRRSVPASIRE